MSDNLAIWNRHRTPHKDAAKKKFKKSGGFRGTAIDPMWMIRAATEEFGPMGQYWGLQVLNHDTVEGPKGEVLHWLLGRIWYLDDEGNQVFGIPQFGQTWLVQDTQNGLKMDEECFKKSITDAMTKGLSWLGFGADVYMGMHDGSKYADLDEEESVPGTMPGAYEVNEVESISGGELDEKAPFEGDVLDEVKRLAKEGMEKLGEDTYYEWHVRMLQNLFGVDSLDEVEDVKDLDYFRLCVIEKVKGANNE